MVDTLHAEEASMHVDNPICICFHPQSLLELAGDIHVLLAYMQGAPAGSQDSSVDETAMTSFSDTVRVSRAKKASLHSCIDIAVGDHAFTCPERRLRG